MKIKMPYGKLNIETKEEAVKFIMRACTDCLIINGYDYCSGARSQKCNEIKQQVVKKFSVDSEKSEMFMR